MAAFKVTFNSVDLQSVVPSSVPAQSTLKQNAEVRGVSLTLFTTVNSGATSIPVTFIGQDHQFYLAATFPSGAVMNLLNLRMYSRDAGMFIPVWFMIANNNEKQLTYPSTGEIHIMKFTFRAG